MTSPLQDALAQANDASLIWQLGLVFASWGLAWLLTHFLSRRFAHKQQPDLKLNAISYVLLPLLALTLLIIGKSALQHWMPVSLLRLFIALTLALTLIRAAIHV